MTEALFEAAPGLAFAHRALDRADHIRNDPEKVAALMMQADARIAPLWRGKPFVISRAGAPEPAFLNSGALDESDRASTVFLGLEGDAPVFAMALDPAREPDGRFPLHGLGSFEELRGLAAVLNPRDVSLLGGARSLLAWHEKHGFCSNCGAATHLAGGGWRRACAECGVEHFPRVDPVAIMLIANGENMLLGRQAGWPEGMWSCLAGFIEPGETMEDGARREAMEEAGVRLTRVRYGLSQPWPFPSSLMLGLFAETKDETITVDPSELEDARWFTRDDARAMIAGEHRDVSTPPQLAIAHHLVRRWSQGDEPAA